MEIHFENFCKDLALIVTQNFQETSLVGRRKENCITQFGR